MNLLRYISPTKTPEYLAGGKPVISTPIRDVVSPYGDNNLVHIAATAEEFVACGDAILNMENREQWLKEVDSFLAGNSWDRTWSQMAKHIEKSVEAKPLAFANERKKK
jgi:UDP-galactopyranose mutase